MIQLGATHRTGGRCVQNPLRPSESTAKRRSGTWGVRSAASVILLVFLLILPGMSWGKSIDSGQPAAKGPLQIVGQTPLQTMRLNAVPERHNILQMGRYEFSLYNSWTNCWNNTPSFLLDLEAIQNNFGFAIGVGQRTELGLSIPIISRTGGRLDRVIADFHSLLHIDQEGRTDYPFNSMIVKYYNVETGQWTVLLNRNDQGTALGDASLTFRSQVYRGERPAALGVVHGVISVSDGERPDVLRDRRYRRRFFTGHDALSQAVLSVHDAGVRHVRIGKRSRDRTQAVSVDVFRGGGMAGQPASFVYRTGVIEYRGGHRLL